MRLRFVTGANSAFFPTLMVLLQSFTEQIGGSFPYVCDYGLGANQREFLRRRGALLERAPALGPRMSPLREKAILHEYFQHSGLDATAADAVVWLDGDLTLVGCPRADVEAVAAEMAERDIEIAASPHGTIAEQLAIFRRQGAVAAPFEQLLAESAIDTASPYYSTGVFVCRSASFLKRWSEIGRVAADQPVLDQNLFNVVLHRGTRPVRPLDVDIWQAQGDAIDRLRLEPDFARTGSPVSLNGRPVKILHATSPSVRHLLVGLASLAVRDLVLDGAFKLLRAKPLLELQLGLLARFLVEHGAELVELGICKRAGSPVQGYLFRTIDSPQSGASAQ